MARHSRKWFVIAFVVLIAISVFLIGYILSTSKVTPSTTTPQPSSTPNYSTDPVKNKNGPNGDIAPSSTGTGPGSNSSLLGP